MVIVLVCSLAPDNRYWNFLFSLEINFETYGHIKVISVKQHLLPWIKIVHVCPLVDDKKRAISVLKFSHYYKMGFWLSLSLVSFVINFTFFDQCPIVERLVNSMMMHGRNNGKKLMTVTIVKHSFEIMHLLTGEVTVC